MCRCAPAHTPITATGDPIQITAEAPSSPFQTNHCRDVLQAHEAATLAEQAYAAQEHGKAIEHHKMAADSYKAAMERTEDQAVSTDMSRRVAVVCMGGCLPLVSARTPHKIIVTLQITTHPASAAVTLLSPANPPIPPTRT